MSGGGGRTRPRHVGRWRPNAAAPCRAVAAERGRAMSGGGGRTRPRYVGRWRPNAAASCRAVAAERGRTMSGSLMDHGKKRHFNIAANLTLNTLVSFVILLIARTARIACTARTDRQTHTRDYYCNNNNNNNSIDPEGIMHV